MNTLSKKIQKGFVYIFTVLSVFLVVLGITRIKKTDALAQAAPDTNAGQGSSGTSVLGALVSANFTGKTYSTPWGDVATKIQVKDGKIVSVTTPSLPDSPPSTQAQPYLISQAIKAGGSNIQGVSGATITSRAFQASLESALAQAANAKTGITLPLASANINTIVATPTIISKPVVDVPPVVVVNNTPPAQANAGVSGTFTGKGYQTPWGNAVASITVTNGAITGVTMPQVPNSPPSQYAEPYLVEQALSAGSANIQGVSGATYTSIAFKSSLESAIALANTTASSQGQTTITAPATTVSQAIAPVRTSVPRRYKHEDEWDDD